MERTLTTILVAELTGLEKTVDTGGGISDKILKDHLVAVDRIVTEHHGKLLGNAGGSLAAQFSNPSDAVRCAVVLEETIHASAGEQSIRIGIDQGDVAIENGRVRGDGIKSATELQKRFEGIVISGSVQDQLIDDIGVATEELGEGNNVAYRVRAKDRGINTETSPATFRQVLPKFTLVAGAALVLVLIVSFAIQDQFSYDFEPADLTKYKLELPEKPSIAVLPFDNLSGDPENDYLGDSLTETIIASLGSLPDLIVIARNSVFTYKNKPTKVQQVAEDLGVRYILEGSVQREGDKVRVVAQLIDAVDGKHLWAEKYSEEIESLFDVQDAISEKIAEEMEYNLSFGELARRWRQDMGTPENYRRMRQANEWFQLWNVEGHRKAELEINDLAEKYPDAAGMLVWLSLIFWQKTLLGIDGEFAKNLEIARQHAEAAESIMGEDVTAALHIQFANIEMTSRSCELATKRVQKALELAPSRSGVQSVGGYVLAWCGEHQTAIEMLRLAMRLEPQFPRWYPAVLAEAHAFSGQTDEAKSMALAVVDLKEDVTEKRWMLGLLIKLAFTEGRHSQAREYAKQLIELEPSITVPKLSHRYILLQHPTFLAEFETALSAAGVPKANN